MNEHDLRTSVRPRIAEGAWIAPSADVLGDVTLGAHASVWYLCVRRGDRAPSGVGGVTKNQHLTLVPVDVDRPCRIGAGVGIGHRAIIHGCDIEDGCLVGMGAVVLSDAIVGAGSVIAAGALVTEGARIPPGSLVVGVPGRVVRPVDDGLKERIRLTVDHYRALKDLHSGGRWQPPG